MKVAIQNCSTRLSLAGFASVGLALLMPAVAAETPLLLLNGKDFGGWRQPTGEWQVAGDVSLDPADATKLTPKPGEGVAVNGSKGRTVHLVTKAEFGDAEIHVEFCLARKSNSGVYLQGRYEVQIYDSFGVEKDQYPGIECAGIYPRWINNQNVEGHSPRANASQPPGEWQTFDITFRAPRFDESGRKITNAKFVRVVHNGTVVHENVELTGPTRAGLWDDEKPTGPLMLQGDHGPVAYRNVTVKRLGPVMLRGDHDLTHRNLTVKALQLK